MRLGTVGRCVVPLLAALCVLAPGLQVLGRVRANSWNSSALSGSLLVNPDLFSWHSIVRSPRKQVLFDRLWGLA